MTNILLIVSAVLALVSVILAWRSQSLKGKLKGASQEAQDAIKALGVLTTHHEREKAVTEQEQATADKIKEATDETSIKEIADDIIDVFNDTH